MTREKALERALNRLIREVELRGSTRPGLMGFQLAAAVRNAKAAVLSDEDLKATSLGRMP